MLCKEVIAGLDSSVTEDDIDNLIFEIELLARVEVLVERFVDPEIGEAILHVIMEVAKSVQDLADEIHHQSNNQSSIPILEEHLLGHHFLKMLICSLCPAKL